MIHQEKFNSILINSDSYREFIIAAFQYMKSIKTGYSLTMFARKIGCKSKSYPNDVMNGRRSLSAGYAPGFAAAFGLKGDSRNLFFKLVELEKTTDKESVQKEIQHLKSRIKNERNLKNKKPIDLFEDGDWITIYAGLGSIEKGSSIADIEKRTGFSPALISKILKKMLKKKMIKFNSKTERYYPGTLHYFFEKISQDDFLQKRVLELLSYAEVKARTSNGNKKSFFSCASLSILEKDVPEIKIQMSELLNKFAQNVEVSDGDKVVHLISALLL